MTPAKHSPRIDAPGEELEVQLQLLSERAAALENEKAALEGFAAVAAHELIVPLVMTESYVAALSERLDDDEHADVRADLAALGRGAARARILVEALLHEARSSDRALVRRPVDLNRLVHECVALLRPEIEAHGASIEIGDLPVVSGDESLLNGVFGNLLVNALKYSPRQEGAIRVGAERELAVWRFVVSSEGPTIPSEDRERIFEPFHRSRRERRERGVGLGLAICRRIIERHGGTIGVTGANGGGNSFYFTLPAR